MMCFLVVNVKIDSNISVLCYQLQRVEKVYYLRLMCFTGYLQNGRNSDEDARGRGDAREEDGKDFPTDGQEP